jgi:hypothetical protein
MNAILADRELRNLMDLIEDLEEALDYSRGRFVRPRIEAAIDYLWKLRCELCEKGRRKA